MKKFVLLVVILGVAVWGKGQSPRAVVQAQLEAYNDLDIDAFISVFAEDAKLYTFDEETPRVEGAEALRKIYGQLFKESPQLHSEILNRTIIGNKVIDYEKITGRKGDDKPLFLVMIYEVENGKIVKATSIRE